MVPKLGARPIRTPLKTPTAIARSCFGSSLTFHGSKIVLLFNAYDKGKDPSEKRQAKEIKKARKCLKVWKGEK